MECSPTISGLKTKKVHTTIFLKIFCKNIYVYLRRTSTSDDSGAPQSIYDGSTSSFEIDFDVIDERDLKILNNEKDDHSSIFGSQYSFCSCSYCFGSKKRSTEEYSIGGMRLSICER